MPLIPHMDGFQYREYILLGIFVVCSSVKRLQKGRRSLSSGCARRSSYTRGSTSHCELSSYLVRALACRRPSSIYGRHTTLTSMSATAHRRYTSTTALRHSLAPFIPIHPHTEARRLAVRLVLQTSMKEQTGGLVV